MNEHILDPLRAEMAVHQKYADWLQLSPCDDEEVLKLIAVTLKSQRSIIRELDERIKRESKIDYQGLRVGNVYQWRDFEAWKKWSHESTESLGKTITITGLYLGSVIVSYEWFGSQHIPVGKFFDFFTLP